MEEKGVSRTISWSDSGLWNWMDDDTIPELGSTEGGPGIRQTRYIVNWFGPVDYR